MMNYNALQAVLAPAPEPWPRIHRELHLWQGHDQQPGQLRLNVNGYSGAFQNYYNSAADMGPAGYDVKHNVSATGVYALPVGRGKEFLSSPTACWMK